MRLDTDDAASGGQRRAGERPHESGLGAAVDERVTVSSDPRPDVFGHFGIERIVSFAGAEIDGDIHTGFLLSEMELQSEVMHVVPVTANGDIGGKVGIVVEDGPLRIARDVIRIRILGGGAQGMPAGVGVFGAGLFGKDVQHGVVAFLAVAVDAVLLMRQDFVFVEIEEIGDRGGRRGDETSVFAVAIVFDDAAVARRVCDVEMVIASGCREHVIAGEELDGFFRRGGAVEHETNGERRADGRFPRILARRLGIQGEDGDGNAFFIDAVQADEGRHERREFL